MQRGVVLKRFSALALLFNILIAAPLFAALDIPRTSTSPRPEKRVVPRRATTRKHGTQAFARTELFFGTARPDGAVTDAQFREFIDREVTPRFPDGLTLRKADGQFMGPDGIPIKEDSYVLVLLYPIASQKEHNLSIETIRRLYMTQYQQDSVLRVDDPLLVWVTF